MNIRCEEIMAALATGGAIRRWRALRHAARCPRCAAARDDLKKVALVLANVPPLTAAQRRLWVAAAGNEITAEPSRTWWFRPVLAGALAASVIGAIGIWWTLRPVDLRQRPPAVADLEPAAVGQEAIRDVEGLRGGVLALAQELDDLRRRADLLDARKEVDDLLARLGPRGESPRL
jgi:hypothetical protein